ncbi:MAG: hypothetical protein ACFB0C_02660 [Leptolyngbyaceae cyanobacterium]
MRSTYSFSKPAFALGAATALSVGAVCLAPAAQAATYYDLDFNYNGLVKNGDTSSAGDPLSAYLLDSAGGQYGYGTLAGSFDAISTIWEDDGIFITTDPKGRRTDPLGLFNSNCNPDRHAATDPCEQKIGGKWKGDPDLATGTLFGTSPQGNLLIFEENPGDGAPDDTKHGGVITFDVSSKNWFLEEIGFVDDISGGLITYTFADDTMETDAINIAGDNKLEFYSPTQAKEIKTVAVEYYGSGAISGLRFKEAEPVVPRIPEPTATLGLAIFGAIATRLKRQA